MILDAFIEEMNAPVILYTEEGGTDSATGLPKQQTKVEQWSGLGFIQQLTASDRILAESVRAESTHILLLRFDSIAPTTIKKSWLAWVNSILFDIVKADDVANQHEVTAIGLKEK